MTRPNPLGCVAALLLFGGAAVFVYAYALTQALQEVMR